MHIKIYKYYIAIIYIISSCLIFTNILVPIEATSLDNSVELVCQTETVTLSGIEWKVYKVGELDSNGDYQLVGNFSNYPIELNNLSTSDMLSTANTLENYAILDNITPTFNSITNEDGKVQFENLKNGLYLFSGQSKIIDDTKYIPSAMLIELIPEDDSLATVDLVTYPKFILKHISYENTNYTVKKVWQDDEEHLDNRPISITIELYKDNILENTVVLDESNDWSYSWTSNTATEWRVKEVNIPRYYRVIYLDGEVQYVVMNIYDTNFDNSNEHEDGSETITTTSEDVITDDSSTTTDTTNTVTTTTETSTTFEDSSTTTVSTATIDTTVTTNINTLESDNDSNNVTTTSEKSRLPQTGQLWWPVPILSIFGLVCITVSCRLSIKK